MMVHQLKDGLMWQTESGTTPLPKKVLPYPFSMISLRVYVTSIITFILK